MGDDGGVRSGRPRRGRVGLGIALLLAVAVGWTWLHRGSGPMAIPQCTVGVGATAVTLSPAEAANAATIAGVGLGLGLPDHAVTIALATALQESGLDNLTYGDRDSLGLFQQRSSQGWGSPAQILNPRYAATAFYTHLAHVSGWQTMPVTEAAQSVQRSAAPAAYADWEPEARALAVALTGEVPAAVSCQWGAPAAAGSAATLPAVATATFRAPVFSRALPVKEGWAVASWTVTHADTFGLGSVSFDGQRWTAVSGRWSPSAGAGLTVRTTPAGT